MKRFRCAPGILAAVTWGALAIPGDARANLYELSWNQKYGKGDIVFDGSVLDSNPDPTREDYLGAIVSYDLTVSVVPLNFFTLSGHSGEISVQNPGPDMPPQCEDANAFCPGATLTFWLDSTESTADPAGFHMVLTAPWSLGNFFDHLPLPAAPCDPKTNYDYCSQFMHPFNGEMVPNTPNDDTYESIIEAGGSPALLQALSAVPEPTTIALFGFGLAALAMTNARRAHTTTGSGSRRMPKRP